MILKLEKIYLFQKKMIKNSKYKTTKKQFHSANKKFKFYMKKILN